MDKGSDDPTAEITAAAASLEKVSQEIEQQFFFHFLMKVKTF